MDAYTCNDLVVLYDSLVHKGHWLGSQIGCFRNSLL